MGHTFQAKNALVITTIGVALAMVRDTGERGVTNSTDDDISVASGVRQKPCCQMEQPGIVEVTVEVDTQRHVVRAIAAGATELRSETLMLHVWSDRQAKKLL